MQNVCIRLVVIIMLAVSLSSCTYQKIRKQKFVEHYNKIRVGMTKDEIVLIFGEPDFSYKAIFGKNLGEEWVGHVYRYSIDYDESYPSIRAKKFNTFVFAEIDGILKLNHWRFQNVISD